MDDGKVSACYAKQGGALRVIDKAKGQTCKASERRLVWNQRGLRGLAGAAGAAGAKGAAGAAGSTGPAGPAGPAGPVALKYIGSGPFGVGPGQQDGVDIDCPEGTAVVGGGLVNGSIDTKVNVNMSAPFDDEDADIIPDDGWSAYLNNDSATPGEVGFQVWAICSSATSITFGP